MRCEPVRLSYSLKMFARAHFFRWVIMTRKVGQTDLFLALNRGSSVGLYMQDYNSLCATVTICSTLVNIHTHSILTSLYEKLSQLS